MLRRLSFAVAILPVMCTLSLLNAGAQTPVALPYTMTTIGGLAPMTASSGTQCPNLPSGVKSTDAFGDGCLAVNGIFGAAARAGVEVDSFGNVFVGDDINKVLHVINPSTGIMTVAAGLGSACSAKVDEYGDGCVAATQTTLNGFRGIGIDPYGNVIVAGYNDDLIHVVCRTASPLCGSGTPSASNPILTAVGNMELVAGCAATTTGLGTAGTGLDNTPAFSTAANTVAAFQNSGTCGTSKGELNTARGATADAYGNVYYAETALARWRVVLGPQTYNGVTNPLWAVLEKNPSWTAVTAGYVYTVAGLTSTATTKGSTTGCNGTGTALDTHGDGCLFTSGSVNSSTSDAQGVAVDAAGNMIFTDAGNGLMRVLFVSGSGTAGTAMVNAIEINNAGMSPSTPQTGFFYPLAGNGSTGGVSATPTLGNSRTALDSSTLKLATSPQGNIYIGDSTRVLFFDINTGYIRILFTQVSSNIAAGSSCTLPVGQKSLSAYSDGCAASSAEFENSNGLGLGVDGQGSVYLYDANSNTSGMLVRKVLAQGLAAQTVGVPLIQTFQAHLQGATSPSSTVKNSTNGNMSYGSPSCTLNADDSVDCNVTVTATPSEAGLRSAEMTVSNASSGEAFTVALGGTVTGSVLAFDNASTTTNSVTTPVAPTTNSIFSSITPASVAVDGAGNVYAASGASILESIAGTSYTLSSSLPATPSQIAVDQTGNVFAVASGQSVIGELKVTAAGTPSTYSLTSISYTPTSGTAAPQAIALDVAGNIYVADKTTESIYRLSLVANTLQSQMTVASGFSNPVSLAVDGSGNVYVADQGASAVYKLTPVAAGGYTQTTLISSVTPVAVAVDPAGDAYVQSGTSVFEVAVNGSEVTVLTGLQNPTGLAVDGLGNVYSADAHNTSITQVVRDAGSYGPTAASTTTFAGTLTNIGNLSTALSQTDASEFPLTFGSGAGCSSAATTYTAGLACTLQANFSSAKSAGTPLTDLVTFSAAGSLGSVTFNDQVPAGPTSVSITGSGNPLYAASGTEATYTIIVTGIAAPTGTSISVTVKSVTVAGSTTVFSSAPTLNASGMATVNLSGLAPGAYTISANYAGVTNVYAPSSAQLPFTIQQFVATGDTRTVTEPAFPAVCTQLTAALTSVSDDIPTTVDATVTNLDGARIQAALASCSGTGKAVELSVDGAGHNAYITGPLSMPSNVTLLVDPGVYVYFSRNVQDYDKVAGTHTCGTVGSASATASCLPLIDIPGTSTNVGIMGFGKLDGRGGDVLINAISPYGGQSWWGLSAIANSGGTQENPRFIQIDTGASNITLYKITIRNSPLFHISTTGAASNFTAWDIKIITPTSSRNTDGIDPGNATNFTITRSWVSDGDDNIAVGAAGTTAPAANISVTNNHFFAGHGESIGSYTSAGVSNILFDSNMSSGNGTAGVGSSINNTADSNSTGLRIKSGYDRGGVVTNVQYSNSCYQDHKAEIVFSPNYEATTGSESPNLENILMQNLTFLTAGTAQFTGTSNSGTVYQLGVTLDNVTFPGTFAASEFSPSPTNTSLAYGPGQVSADFIADYATFVGANANTVTNNITETALVPPTCNFTYIAPELTGPAGLPQTIIAGQNATAVVILTPAVGGAAYPTGTVTLTDALTSIATTVTLSGTTDTIAIPLDGLSVGTHTFTATYSGDSNYTLTGAQTVYSTTAPYVITVTAGSLSGTTTILSGVPSATTFGTSFTAGAVVTGSSPTGTVEFIVGGGGAVGTYVYATSALAAGSASATFNLPYSLTPYSITAVYSGDAVNAGSTSPVASVTINQGLTTTALSANKTTTTLGHPIALTATVTSSAGIPSGTVNFTYSITSGGTQISLGSAILSLSAGLSAPTASASVDLPIGTDYVTATYVASGSFAGSVSAPMTITVNVPTIIGLTSNPIPLPYTMTTIAGGSGLAIPSSGNMACAGATDKYGDGCQATAIGFTATDDMRAVVADPFGNVYLSDISATLVRRITPNGVISNFAGLVSGTACVPSATTGCKPTQVSVGKARGVGSDAAGNIYIANYTGNQIFEVKVSTGLMYLVAGNGTGGSTGDGSAATSAEVNSPRGAWGDTVGNIYIADTADNKIRVVDATGNIHTFAGNGTAGSTGDGAAATAAEINNPQGVIVDANLNVYIADSSGGRIRVVCVTCGTGSPLDALLAKLGIASPVNGDIYTVAGNASTSTDAYTVPVLSTGVSMSPQKLAFDNAGNLYISDGNGFIWFLDFHTGYLRAIAANATTVCSSHTDVYGDGCPATQASFGDGGNGIGVGADTQGNIYISDTTNGLIRKVVTGLASPSTTAASTTTLPVQLHFIAGDTVASSSALAFTSPEWSLGKSTCATNGDTTSDCLLTSSFTPAVPGTRSTPLTVNSSLGNTANLALTGTGLGAGSTLDPATQSSFGANLQVAGLVLDNAGNVYVSDTISKKLLRFAPSTFVQGASAASTTLATLTAPGPVAVDPRGFVYVADTSTGLITQISPSGTPTTLALTLTTPAGLAADALNNLYISDSSAQAVYQLNPITGAVRTLAVATLVAPAGLAIDPSGNLLITDPGAAAIYRFNLQSGVTTTVTSSAVKPAAIAIDAAGNLLIGDTAAILAVPASTNSASFTVAGLAPSALAIDSAGNLYTGSKGAVLMLTRTQGFVRFPGASAPPQTVSLLESGNQPLQLTSISQTDTADYNLAGTASTDCTLSGTLPSALATGGVCALTATYTPTTFVTTIDSATFNGNLVNATLSTPSTVQLVLTGPAAPPASTIGLAFKPASPAYGQSVVATATVSGPSITPAGTVVFTVDGVATSVTLSSGVATLSLTGLSTGPHTVSAVYTSSNGFAPSSTSSVILTVGKATATVVLSNLSQTYTGSPLSATATTTPTGLAVSLTYNGSATAPTAPGSYNVVATINDPNYAGTASGTMVIAKATATVALSNLSQTYTGSPLSATATTTPTGLAVSLTYNGSATAPTAPGSYTVVATVNDPNYVGTATGTLVIAKATPALVSVTSSVNPVFALNPIKLTATVTSTVGTPTGTVTFLDGATPLGTGTLTAGVATLTTSTLAAGSHTITAAYGGDTNFAAATSAALTQVVQDFTISSSPSSVTAAPGSVAISTFSVTPLDGSTFPSPITLTVSGLPAGATYSLSSATLGAGQPGSSVTLTVNIPQTVAGASPVTVHPGSTQLAGNTNGGTGRGKSGSMVARLAPFSLALLLLPFAGRLRRNGKRLGRMLSVLLLLAAGMAAVAGISACGSMTGIFAQQQQTYTVNVTGTANALSHSATVTLTVE